jgi:hypothetical protein
LELIVRGQAFVPPEHPKQTVQVLANGHLIGNWTFHHGDSIAGWLEPAMNGIERQLDD